MKRFALVCILLLIASSLPATAGINVDISIGKTISSSSGNQQKNGPPPWAPAHGRRAKHQYKYHPDAEAYHDAKGGNWFFMEGGNWTVHASLPDSIRVRLGGAVTLNMDSDRPYEHHRAVKSKHPRKGASKSKVAHKNGNGNGNGRGKKK